MIAICFAAAAALALSPAATVASQGPAAVRIDLVSYTYQPTPIMLRAGQPVTLQFVNRAKASHDFTAPAFFHSARMVAGAAPGGRVALRGGQSASVTLIPRAGRYRVHCGRPFHKMMGMQTTIFVR